MAARSSVAFLTLLLVIAGCTRSTIVPTPVTGVAHPVRLAYCSTHTCAPTTTTLPPLSACHHGTVTRSFVVADRGAPPICLYVKARYRLDLAFDFGTTVTWGPLYIGRSPILSPLAGAQMNSRGSETTLEALHVGNTILSAHCYASGMPPCDFDNEVWVQSVEIVK